MNNKSDMHSAYRKLHTIHRQKGVNSEYAKSSAYSRKTKS